MDIKNSPLPKVLILSDSHGKCINRTYSTRFTTKTIAVSGLKWIDDRDDKLSLDAMLSSRDIRSFLSEADALLVLIGTNSTRIMPASRVIGQVREIIQRIQRNYPHLNKTKKINVVCTFPCVKPTNRFPNKYSLLSNINQYNQQLIRLSLEMNFKIVDCQITEYHLANDRIHVNSKFHHLIVDAITNHFNDLFPLSSRSITNTNISVPSTTSTSNEIEIQSQSSQRSRQSNDQRNEKRHSKLKTKLKEHIIKRKIDLQWTLSNVKNYLRSISLKYGRILPMFNKILRIQFYNEHDKDAAENTLGIDAFNEDRYQEVVKNQKL